MKEKMKVMVNKKVKLAIVVSCHKLRFFFFFCMLYKRSSGKKVNK